MAHFTAAIQREFFLLFLLDKNDSLTFVITHKVEAVKENDETTKEVVIRNKWAKNEWILCSKSMDSIKW